MIKPKNISFCSIGNFNLTKINSPWSEGFLLIWKLYFPLIMGNPPDLSVTWLCKANYSWDCAVLRLRWGFDNKDLYQTLKVKFGTKDPCLDYLYFSSPFYIYWVFWKQSIKCLKEFNIKHFFVTAKLESTIQYWDNFSLLIREPPAKHPDMKVNKCLMNEMSSSVPVGKLSWTELALSLINTRPTHPHPRESKDTAWNQPYIQGVPKKRGISECHWFCFTAY